MSDATVATEYIPEQTVSQDYQTEAELEADFIKQLGTQGYEYLSTDSLIVMSYDLYIVDHWETHTTRMKLPAMAWEAGKNKPNGPSSRLLELLSRKAIIPLQS